MKPGRGDKSGKKDSDKDKGEDDDKSPPRVSVNRQVAALEPEMIMRNPSLIRPTLSLIRPSQEKLTWARVGAPTAGDAGRVLAKQRR